MYRINDASYLARGRTPNPSCFTIHRASAGASSLESRSRKTGKGHLQALAATLPTPPLGFSVRWNRRNSFGFSCIPILVREYGPKGSRSVHFATFLLSVSPFS